jgi:hypothetical protein
VADLVRAGVDLAAASGTQPVVPVLKECGFSMSVSRHDENSLYVTPGVDLLR